MARRRRGGAVSRRAWDGPREQAKKIRKPPTAPPRRRPAAEEGQQEEQGGRRSRLAAAADPIAIAEARARADTLAAEAGRDRRWHPDHSDFRGHPPWRGSPAPSSATTSRSKRSWAPCCACRPYRSSSADGGNRTSRSSTAATTSRAPWRSSSGCARPTPRRAIFFVAAESNPDAILQSMRAGANEFFTWPPAKETFHEGIRRTAGRRAATARAAGDHDGVLRRQGRRRHHDDGGQLRRRSGAPQQAAHGDRGPQAGPRRGVAVPRRAQPLHAARRARQPASPRRRVPARAGGEAQVGAGDARRLRSVRSSRSRRQLGARRGVPPARRGSTNTSSSTPDSR